MAPGRLDQLSAASNVQTLKRTFKQFFADNLTDWAAALTYYAVLAVFPAIIALVSILGLVGDSATGPLLDNLDEVAPGPANEILTDAVSGLGRSKEAAGVTLVVSLTLALVSASGYVGAFARASNAIYKVKEGRPVWKRKPAQLGITIVMLGLLVVVALAITITGPLAEQVGMLLGVGDTAVKIWDLAKIPVILLIFAFMLGFLYWAAPNVQQQRFRLFSAGSIVALAIWIAASLLFALYVDNFSSYDRTYGPLAGVIVFLVWLWLTNVAVLFGAELNSELQRTQARQAGDPAPLGEPFLEAREAPKPKD